MPIKINNQIPHGIKKFLILVSILIAYSVFVIYQYGVADGLVVTALTWAFFVMCTPIADAGFLVDFPVRVLFGLKMLWTEVIVWSIALSLLFINLIFNESVFDKIEILRIFQEIVLNPWPLWSVIVISLIGTFLSIYVGDQIYNLIQEAKRSHHLLIKAMRLKRLLIEILMLVIIVIVYFSLLNLTHLSF